MKCNVYVERETGEFVGEWRMLEGGWPAEGWPGLYERGRHELTEKGLNVHRGSSEILA